eukprot:5182891-Pyramimonas_sp.AAC.1
MPAIDWLKLLRPADASAIPSSRESGCMRGSANRNHELQRDRWAGPGAVVFQARGTVWVAMRHRLLWCSVEQ